MSEARLSLEGVRRQIVLPALPLACSVVPLLSGCGAVFNPSSLRTASGLSGWAGLHSSSCT